MKKRKKYSEEEYKIMAEAFDTSAGYDMFCDIISKNCKKILKTREKNKK